MCCNLSQRFGPLWAFAISTSNSQQAFVRVHNNANLVYDTLGVEVLQPFTFKGIYEANGKADGKTKYCTKHESRIHVSTFVGTTGEKARSFWSTFWYSVWGHNNSNAYRYTPTRAYLQHIRVRLRPLTVFMIVGGQSLSSQDRRI